MTSHLNIDWEGTRELNRREFNTNARWYLTHNSASPISTDVYAKLNKGGGKGTKYEADPLVPVPVALRKDLHRRQVSVEADIRARAASNNNRTLPDVTSPNKQAKFGQNSEQASVSAATSTLNTTSIDDEDAETETQNAQTRRLHCHRKHKKNCPKHLLNEMRRRKEAEEKGIAPLPYSEVLDGPSAIPCTVGLKPTQIIQSESNVDRLIKDTPFLVGRSMAYVFTGSYDPSVNVRKHRMEEEHPNFAQNDKKIDKLMDTYRNQLGASRWGEATYSTFSSQDNEASPLRSPSTLTSPNATHKQSSFLARTKMPLASTTPPELIATLKETPPSRMDGPHRHLTHTKVVPEKLLKDEVDPAHFRKKYEMKTHMEKMRSMGPGLLREFANGKGFK